MQSLNRKRIATERKPKTIHNFWHPSVVLTSARYQKVHTKKAHKYVMSMLCASVWVDRAKISSSLNWSESYQTKHVFLYLFNAFAGDCCSWTKRWLKFSIQYIEIVLAIHDSPTQIRIKWRTTKYGFRLYSTVNRFSCSRSRFLLRFSFHHCIDIRSGSGGTNVFLKLYRRSEFCFSTVWCIEAFGWSLHSVRENIPVLCQQSEKEKSKATFTRATEIRPIVIILRLHLTISRRAFLFCCN